MRHRGTTLAFHTGLCLAILASLILAQVSQATPATAASGALQRIVYLDRDNNVWTSQTDGSDVEQLTTTGGFGNVRMSADGTRILATGPYNGETGIYLFSTDGDGPSGSIATGRLPVWSPDNSHFAFAQDGYVHVFTRDLEFVVTSGAPAHVLQWSPDGQRIGFARNLVDAYGSGCAVRQLGWIDAESGAAHTAGAAIGQFAWNGSGTALLHVSASDGAIRARSVIDDSNPIISTTLINPCGAPFFTTADGRHLISARWTGQDQTNLVVIDQRTREETIYSNVPVDFPASRLPSSSITGDATGRYITLVRSYPTDIHRIDLESGEMWPILTNDWRRVLGFSPNGDYFALLLTPTGRAPETVIYHLGGSHRTVHGAGWLSWQPSPLNVSAAVAWQRSWDREDRPVIAGESRTWLWGPEFFDARVEEYDETPGGFRAVRYYDKSRMELTHPAGDRNSEWYVTNGLLVRELITGQMQVGDNRFVGRQPSEIPVAGDHDDPNSPSYATLGAVLDAPAAEPGTEITARIDGNGNITEDGPGGVTAAHVVEDTGHTVASVFWDYLNSTGTVWDGQQFTEGRLFEPTFFATGLPITEAYWARVLVGGNERDVLLQCFERRCLTYTPANPDGWQVEMGNVGRHYHAWRY